MPLFGHAIEARISCEDPANDFLPQTGKLSVLRERSQAHQNEIPDVRIETGVREGDIISPYYDPMISKVIAHGESREEAIQKLQRALHDMTIIGVPTNTKFIKRILGNKTFQGGEYSTNFIQDEHEQLFSPIRNISSARKSNISAA